MAPRPSPSASRSGLSSHGRAVADRLSRRRARAVCEGLAIPRANLARGAAGIAAFLAEAARLFAVERYLAAAGDYLAVARDLARRRASGFGPRKYEREFGVYGGLYTGSAGLPWVAAHLADVAGDRNARGRWVRALVRRWQARAGGPHLSLHAGAAGFAEAAAEALAHFEGLDSTERAALEELGAQATERLLAAAGRPLAPGERLGMAFGRAGILYAALRWAPGEKAVVDGLSELARAAARSGPLIAWPPRWGDGAWDNPMLGAWCNGMTGLARLFLRARRTLRSRLVNGIARACEQTLSALPAVAPTLCCGAMGQALTLGDLGRDPPAPWLVSAARPLARQALAAPLPPDLLVGAAGVAWGALALAREDVRRPLGFA